MKQKNIFLLILFFAISGWIQGQLQPFKDDIESHADFQQNDLVGWTSLDLDGRNTAGSYHQFPGKGGKLGFIVYTPSQTDPPNEIDDYKPRSGKKYFVSISSYDGPVNDWLISKELDNPSGGTFSFYAKSGAIFAGADKFKVGYSTTGADPSNFTFFNATPTSTTGNWVRYQYTVPAGIKHLAINCVSQAYMMLVDDIEFAPNVAALAPNTITGFTVKTQLNTGFQAVFNWVNPTIDSAGNALGNMTGVKVYRGTHPMNLVEIADLPSGSGQSMTYTDTLPSQGSYNHRFVPYNSAGKGKAYDTPVTFFGYETKPGAPANIKFTQNGSLQTVISWDKVDYGATGGVLQNPVTGYKIVRSLGNTTVILADMHPGTTYTETSIPDLNLYTYSIIAQTSATDLGVPAVISANSGMNAHQSSVTTGITASEQPFELGSGSIISQSIYKPNEIGGSGLITSLSYFGNQETMTKARYKIYMSVTNRSTFGTTLANAKWEYFATQKLLYDGEVEFLAGRNATTIKLDQPFYYNASNNENVIITIVKPLTSNTNSSYPLDFYNTPVEGMRTYYANGYSVDLSVITSQPASWSTEEILTVPSIVVEKMNNFGSLSGKVTLAADGTPLDNVTVTVTPDGSETYQTETVKTNSTGNYIIPALMPGNYVVTFSKATFNNVQKNISIQPNNQFTQDTTLDNSLPILITGTVKNISGNGIEGITINLTGFSNLSTITDATGKYTLNAFADKQYKLQATHPLYIAKEVTFKSDAGNQTIAPITLDLALNKPGNVVAVNNNGIGNVEWRTPVGTFNETTLGWGSFITSKDAWGNAGKPFIAASRFEPADLKTKLTLTEKAELTHVKAYFANNAEVIIKIFEGPNAEKLIHSQPASVTGEDWYVFELTKSLPIDFNKELWIGIEFLSGQYGAYPLGLDDGPNAPGKKGSMKYENGTWTQLSLTNKNWNIYGIVNNTMDAEPAGYKVYRSPSNENNWTELTTSPITATNFSDTSLNNAAPNTYKYGVIANYGTDLASQKAISNEIQHNMFFDFSLNITPDFGSAQGAYVSIWNDDNFAETFASASPTVKFTALKRGNYNVRVELDNYKIVELSNITVEENSNINVPLSMLKVQPSNLTATLEGTSAKLDWTLHGSYTDKIEKYKDFERQNIGNYIMKDLDGLPTYTYNNFTWPDSGVPMAFMVFNPFATTPKTEISAVSGRKFLTAFAGPDGPNNDWLIIPAGSGKFSFSAASLVGAEPENIRILYSTTGTEVSNFTALENLITVPEDWTQYSVDVPKGTKYVAINYVSNDSYFLKLDDLSYEKEYNHVLYYRVYLDGVLAKDNLKETNFMLGNLTSGEHTAEVEAVYETGGSQKTEVKISVLGVDDLEITKFSVYPNPSSGKFWLKTDSKATVSIFDLNGRLLYSGVKEAGTSMMENNYAAGNYIIQIQTEKGTSTKKLIIK